MGDAEDRAALAKLDFLWSASNDPTGDPVPVSEWQTTESIVDLAELDAGCLMADDVDRGGLEIEMNRMLDNLKPIERWGDCGLRFVLVQCPTLQVFVCFFLKVLKE